MHLPYKEGAPTSVLCGDRLLVQPPAQCVVVQCGAARRDVSVKIEISEEVQGARERDTA